MKLTKVMYYINRIWREKPYTIIFIDAEKAFDKIRDENSQQTMNTWELPPHNKGPPDVCAPAPSYLEVGHKALCPRVPGPVPYPKDGSVCDRQCSNQTL